MLKTVFLWFQIIIIFSCTSICYPMTFPDDKNPRIVGGTGTSVSSVPYLVNLRRNGYFFCGGSLVSSKHVVTAAHCVKGVNARSLSVRGGATYLSESGVQRDVEKVICPKAYRPNTMDMDVAVLKLTSPMTGSNIETIRLCTSNWKVGDMVQVSGWGVMSENSNVNPNRVQTVKIPLISKATCKQRYRGQAVLTNNMFCATVPGSKDSCSGDSGGPVVYNGQLCGIVSWGIGCARNNYPGVYTRVNSVKSFIEKAMKL